MYDIIRIGNFITFSGWAENRKLYVLNQERLSCPYVTLACHVMSDVKNKMFALGYNTILV